MSQQADDRPEQLFVLTRHAPKSDRVNRQQQRPRGSLIYRKGSKPNWADDDDSSEGEIQPQRRFRPKKAREPVKMEKIQRSRRPAEPVVVSSRTIASAVVVKKEKGVQDEEAVEDQPAPKPKKEIDIDLSKLEIPEGPEGDSDEDEESSDDDADDRRAQLRRRKMQKMKEEEERKAKLKEEQKEADQDEDEDEDEDEDSEYESESEEEPQRTMLKPVFVSKRQRQTIEERAKMEEEEAAYEEEQRQRDKERKQQATKLVIEQLKLEEEAKLKAAEEEMPDDTDGINEDEEIKAWKLRELRRMKREQDFREHHKKEQEEIEKRRNMTDEEIAALNRNKPEKERGKMRFLQKYFHKGAFFQDEDHAIFKRDFNEATGLDKEVDRERLPKVLQVKNFGLMSRTKYTHLVDQDTTFASKSKHELQEEERLKEKNFAFKRKLAGTGRVDEAFRKRSRKKEASSSS